MSEERLIAYTSAPVDYDWGWCRTEIDHVAEDPQARSEEKKILRQVSVEDKYHYDHQLGRYGSGLYYALDQAQFDELVEHNLLVRTPEKQMTHHRFEFDLPEDFEFDSEGEFFKLYTQTQAEFVGTPHTLSTAAFGGGRMEVRLHVVGDENLFDSLCAELQGAAGVLPVMSIYDATIDGPVVCALGKHPEIRDEFVYYVFRRQEPGLTLPDFAAGFPVKKNEDGEWTPAEGHRVIQNWTKLVTVLADYEEPT